AESGQFFGHVAPVCVLSQFLIQAAKVHRYISPDQFFDASLHTIEVFLDDQRRTGADALRLLTNHLQAGLRVARQCLTFPTPHEVEIGHSADDKPSDDPFQLLVLNRSFDDRHKIAQTGQQRHINCSTQVKVSLELAKEAMELPGECSVKSERFLSFPA